jgi:hypothetical protein
MTEFAEFIYRGKVGADGLAGIRNPLVKVLTIVVPLAVIFFQNFARQIDLDRFSNGELVFIATLSYVSVIINFETKERNRFANRLLRWVVIVGVAYLITMPSLDAYTQYLSFMAYQLRVLHAILGHIIDAESFSTILLIVPMYVGIRNFTTRDALWLGRKILWSSYSNLLFQIYVVVIVAVSVLNTALPLRVSVSWIVAKDKALLLKNHDLAQSTGWFKRLGVHVWLFASTLIGHNTRMAIAIETLTRQRGMFRDQYRDPIATATSSEDIVVLVLCLLNVFSLVVFRFAE